MVLTLSTAVSTTPAVLALSKTAWKLGSFLSKLDQNSRTVDITAKDLAVEVKSLGNECDLIYTELEEVLSDNETQSSLSYDVDGRMWNCLAMQVEETGRTMQELELFVKAVRQEEFGFVDQSRRQRKLDRSKDQIASIRTKVCRHTDKLRTSFLLINTVIMYIAPHRAERGLARELEKLQDMIRKLQRSSEANPQPQYSHTESTLVQYAHEIIMKGMAMYESSPASNSGTVQQSSFVASDARNSNWVTTMESMRREEQHPGLGDMISGESSPSAGKGIYTIRTSAQHHVQQNDPISEESDDDLEIDLAKAALDSGTKAFETEKWEEADSLLQEALQILQQLPKHRRTFCDIFSLQYKLAVCAYHTHDPTNAEEALLSLVQQSASSDEHRKHICDSMHLLSLLYIRMGRIDLARSECEKALQARRRLLGKQSDPSLESIALMAHIHALLNNRARAKSFLTMIPEAHRGTVLQNVGQSLGTKLEHLDSWSPLTQSISGESDLTTQPPQNRFSVQSLPMPTNGRRDAPVPGVISQSSINSFRQPHQTFPSNRASLDDRQSTTVTVFSSVEERSEPRATGNGRNIEEASNDLEALSPTALTPSQSPNTTKSFKGRILTRKEIIDNVGCQPRDRIEDAVCKGDHSAFTNLLDKKRDSWRPKFRKHVRSERVTALHFAALFGEIDMARRLLSSGYNINEVPFGYSTSLPPLTFAVGARQVDMVDFLISNGAKPSEPDSWSTLASQLLNRAWLKKTMSEAEEECVPDQIIAILRILLRQGWDINAPFEASGATVLHQAVSFWMGSCRWDLSLRAAVTSFLCEHGANPFKANAEGKTPYDIASASGHRDLLLVLERGSKDRQPYYISTQPVELPSDLSNMV